MSPGAASSEAAVDELLAERLHQEAVECPIRPLSAIVREHGVEQIDLLKIDVEKSELEVLEGIAGEDWPKIKQLVVEVHDIDKRLARVTALLRGQGYTVSVDQDPALAGSWLYSVYAIHPSRAAPGAAEQDGGGDNVTWSSVVGGGGR